MVKIKPEKTVLKIFLKVLHKYNFCALLILYYKFIAV